MVVCLEITLSKVSSSIQYRDKTKSNIEELSRIMSFLVFDPQKRQLYPKANPHEWYDIKAVFKEREKDPIKNKTDLAKYLRLSRPTLNKNINIAHGLSLKKEAPTSTEPSWYKRFYATKTMALLTTHFPNPNITQEEKQELLARVEKGDYTARRKLLDPRKDNEMGYIRQAWHLLEEKREPIEFTTQDFYKFFGIGYEPIPEFQDLETHAVEYGKCVALRWCMKFNLYPQSKALFDDPRFSPVKRKKGKRKMWFLDEGDLQTLINVIDDPQFLVTEYYGIISGVRGNTLLRAHYSDIHPDQYQDGSGNVHFFETKTQDTTGGDVFKPMLKPCIDFLLIYAHDFGLDTKGKDKKLFPYKLEVLNDKLSGVCDGRIIKREPNEVKKDGTVIEGKQLAITSHIHKHTCATLMLKHRVELDAVSTYTHTDPKTLMDFYSGASESKVVEQVLDLPRSGKTWKQFVLELHKQVVSKYVYLMKQRNPDYQFLGSA
jgi:integrase